MNADKRGWRKAKEFCAHVVVQNVLIAGELRTSN
jgi:hypothetical protein